MRLKFKKTKARTIGNTVNQNGDKRIYYQVQFYAVAKLELLLALSLLPLSIIVAPCQRRGVGGNNLPTPKKEEEKGVALGGPLISPPLRRHWLYDNGK